MINYLYILLDLLESHSYLIFEKKYSMIEFIKDL